MNNLNSLLNVWDFEQESYLKTIKVDFSEISKIANKYPGSYVHIQWKNPFNTRIECAMNLLSSNNKFEPIRLKSFNKLESKIFKDPLLISFNFDIREKVLYNHAYISTKNMNELEQIREIAIYNFCNEFLIVGNKTSASSVFIQDVMGERIYPVDRNKICIKKLGAVLKNNLPHLYKFYSEQKIYPIMDAFLEERLKKGIVMNFEVIYKDQV